MIENIVCDEEATSSESSSTTPICEHKTAGLTSNVVYDGLNSFRKEQLALGVDLSHLTDEQWGFVSLHKCHHISTTTIGKDGSSPQSYRVRICKTCCQDAGHIELGTYVDMESAILVNDAYEIMHDRTDRLIVLRKEDKPYLHLLRAKRFDRLRGRDSANILEMLTERSAQQLEVGSGVLQKRKSFSSVQSSDSASSRSISPISSSPLAMRVASTMSAVALRDPLSPSTSSAFSADTTGEYENSSMGSNNAGGLTPAENNDGGGTCTVEMDTDEAVVEGEGSYSVLDSLASLVNVASAAAPSSPTPHPRPPRRNASFAVASNDSSGGAGGEASEDTTMTSLLLLKGMPDTNLSPAVVNKRQRSSTFSAPSFGRQNSSGLLTGDAAEETPMAALTWLASMQADDLDVAKSLFQLSGACYVPGSSSSGGGRHKAVDDESIEYAHDAQFGEDAHSPYHHYNVDLLLPGEELLTGGKSGRLYNSRTVATPSNRVVSSRSSGGVSGTGRARSYSMTYIEKSSGSGGAAASNGSGGSNTRGRTDPLSAALKRFNNDKTHGVLGNNGSSSALAHSSAAGGSTEGYIGIYSPEERKARIKRFIEKRKVRMWTKKVKYDVRKNFADSRVRVKGRFVRKEEESTSSPQDLNTSSYSLNDLSFCSNTSGGGTGDYEEEDD